MVSLSAASLGQVNTVAGVLRTRLLGFRFVTAGMLDHRRIAFKSAAATHGISRKSRDAVYRHVHVSGLMGQRRRNHYEHGE